MSAKTPSQRDSSIDLLRGVVMCLMVLDHARDFSTSPPFNPTDPDKTYAALFFTRFVTHFCAPVFMLLAGAGAGLAQRAGRQGPALMRFLFTRGLWLVFLEFTWVHFGWTFELGFQSETAQVIWALGLSMIFLALLVPLGPRVAGIIGLVMVLSHNALDGIDEARFGHLAWLWQILHTGGPIALGPTYRLYIAYPLVPWIGVMALGYAFGWAWPKLGRRELCAMGAICVVAFVVLRGVNSYGDPRPHPVEHEPMRMVFAFLNCKKYPPSLDYLLMTLGPALIALGLLRGRALDGPCARVVLSYGRAPLFFYLLHLPLLHAMTLPFRVARGLPLIATAFDHGLDVSLPTVYAMWLLALAILWWPTQRWAQLKATRRDAWLSYL
jgi:uncharacterized membrane protein